jgi:hypothetical protein
MSNPNPATTPAPRWFARFAAVVLLVHQGRGKAHLDIPGTITSVLGLLALVYGFTKAETDGWTSGITIGLLIAAVVLLVAFVWIEIGTKDPLLPMRVLTDRNRGGAYLGLALASELWHDGFEVWLADVSPDALEETLAAAKASGYKAWHAGTVKKQGDRKAVVIPSLDLEYDGSTLQVR